MFSLSTSSLDLRVMSVALGSAKLRVCNSPYLSLHSQGHQASQGQVPQVPQALLGLVALRVARALPE